MSDQRAAIQPPPGSLIHVAEASSNRLIIVLPPGGRNARALGFFAVMWLTITAAISAILVASLLGNVEWEGDAPPLGFIIPFLSVFWAVGLGMGYAWLKLTYTRTMLSLEPSRFAAQYEFLGRKKFKLLEVDMTSRAELVEAYSENERPVYRVAVMGLGGEERFGTALQPFEKEWLVLTINAFWQHGTSSPSLTGDAVEPTNQLASRTYPGINGASFSIRERVPELSPSELPTDSRISVDDSNRDSVRISYQAVTHSGIRLAGGLFLGLFCTIWFGVSGVAFVMGVWDVVKDGLAAPQMVLVVGSLFFLMMGAMPLSMLCLLLFGRCVVVVSSDWVRARIEAGPFHKEKRVATDSVVDVGLGATSRSPSVPIRGGPTTLRLRKGGLTCVLLSTELSLPLSLSTDREFNTQLAGLLAFQLRQIGHPLPYE